MNSTSGYPRLLADFGGTHARFALVRGPGVAISDEQTLLTADYAGPFEAARAYLAPLGLAPCWAAFGIASAVAGDAVRMTNNHWSFSREALRLQLGLERLEVINDFTALALSLPHLAPAELTKVGGGSADPEKPIALLGPGTGLGVSGLIPVHRAGEAPRWVALQGEGGHVSFSPFEEREDEVLRILRRQFGHVSAERVLSGPGLVHVYQALAELAGCPAEDLSAAEISTRGVAESNGLHRASLDTFCSILGTCAANLCLTLGAFGGLYIGGGIVPRLGKYFAASPFRQRFEQKGRFSNYLAAIPSFVITAKDPALRGAAAALE